LIVSETCEATGTTSGVITCPCCGYVMADMSYYNSYENKSALEEKQRIEEERERYESDLYAQEMRLLQSLLKHLYHDMCFLNIVNMPRFCRRMMFSKSGFVAKVGKRLKRGK